MNTIAAHLTAAPQPQVSAGLRLAIAVAVAAVLALAWVVAEQASHQAVQTATAALSRSVMVSAPLPTVEIVGRREATSSRKI